MRRLIPLTLLVATAAGLSACGGGGSDPASAPTATTPATSTDGSAAETGTAAQPAAAAADPRKGGFEVALGEWAVTPEAEAIRPGRVTFVIVNRGTMPHGFEIEREDVEDDSSKVETEFLDPGESVEVELDLEAGVYKLECNVEGHDDMGMEMLMEVRRDAPLAAKPAAAKPDAAAVAIEAFAFSPADDQGQGRPDGHLGEPRPGRPHGHVRGRLLRFGRDGEGSQLQGDLRQPRRVPLHLRAPPGDEGNGHRRGVAVRQTAPGRTDCWVRP